MTFKRELVEKKNRNYHMYLNNASSFYNYLLWNKKVHMKGIVSNLLSIVGFGIILPFTSGVWFGVGCFYLGYNILSLGVNFQCVNLQNYNICRFEEKRATLEKIEQRKKESDAKKYATVGAKIHQKLESRVEMPKKEEIVQSLTTLEELEQLKKLALEVKRQHTKTNNAETKNAKVYEKK